MQKFFSCAGAHLLEKCTTVLPEGNQLINTIRRSENWSFFYKGLFDVPAEHCKKDYYYQSKFMKYWIISGMALSVLDIPTRPMQLFRLSC